MVSPIVAAFFLLWLPSAASAERARVQLKDGSELSGELRNYVPGKHVTLVVGGKVLKISAAEAAAVTIGSDVVPPSRPSASPADLTPREPLGKTQIAAPATLLSLGAAALLIGATFLSAPDYDCSDGSCMGGEMKVMGVGFLVGGAVFAATGLIMLPVRLINRRRQAESELSRQARAGLRASLSPWIVPRTSASRMSSGLAATLRF